MSSPISISSVTRLARLLCATQRNVRWGSNRVYCSSTSRVMQPMNSDAVSEKN